MSKSRTKRPKKYSVSFYAICTPTGWENRVGVHSPAGTKLAVCFSTRTANRIVNALNQQLNLQQARTTMSTVIGSAA